PTRNAIDRSLPQLHADVMRGALADAGLTLADVDGYFCAGDIPGWSAPGTGPFSIVEYLGLKLRYLDSTESWGCSYINHLGHAVEAMGAGKCRVALITQAGRLRAAGIRPDDMHTRAMDTPEWEFDAPYRPVVTNMYAMVAKRHMYRYGSTSEQLAWVKVAAS